MKVRLKKGITLKQFSQATFSCDNGSNDYKSKLLKEPLKACITNHGGLVVSVVNKDGFIVPLVYTGEDKEIWEEIEE